MTTSVIPVLATPTVAMAVLYTQAIPSGMDKDVVQVIDAARFQIYAITVHRGLSNIYHPPLLIMLRWDSLDLM